MSAPTLPSASDLSGELEQTPAKHHPHRWRLHRAGIVNVWHYHDNTFQFSGGRMILRGTNGSGKSRALEMLLPFLLDADRRKMDATLAGKVRLEDLMKAGSDATNRTGYLWLEVERTRTDDELAATPADGDTAYLTVGAFIRFSTNTSEARPWYFTTDLRVGHDLLLLDSDRQVLSRDKLTEAIGADRITDSPEQHRERIRTSVFGLTGTIGKERFTGLIQLLHTLRSPDVGNRINEGKLPQILSDALPPLSETALKDAGDRLDGLSETRAQQRRMEQALKQLQDFLDVYRRYASASLLRCATTASSAAAAARAAGRTATAATNKHNELSTQHGQAVTDEAELAGHVDELTATITGIKSSVEYRSGRDLDAREGRVNGLRQAATSDLRAAASARETESRLVDRLDSDAADVVAAASVAQEQLDTAREHLTRANVPAGTLPVAVTATLTDPPALVEPARLAVDEDPQPQTRRLPKQLTITPDDLPAAVTATRQVGDAAKHRSSQAKTRLATARELLTAWGKVGEADKAADDVEYRLSTEEAAAENDAAERDTAARQLANDWRVWSSSETTSELLGPVDWTSTPVVRLLLNVDSLLGPEHAAEQPHQDDPDGSDLEQDQPGQPAGLPDVPTLDDLDRAAHEAAQDAYTLLAHQEAALDTAETAGRTARELLTTEKRQLENAHDPDPARAPWVTALPAGAVPLWQAIDFTTDTTPEQQRGLEAALLAAGLLTAIITADGQAVAQDGQVLLTPDAPPATHPLTAHLQADPTSATDTATVSAVLERISVTSGHPTWVSTDGRWGHGPLRGRHQVPAARHIGAAARAASRAARLVEIGQELDALELHAADRTVQRTQTKAARSQLTQHLRTAPRTTDLRNRRTLAAQAACIAAETASEARRARERAEALRTAWTTSNNQHRSICDQQGLPHDEAALYNVTVEADAAVSATSTLADRIQTLVASRKRYDSQTSSLSPQQQARQEAEQEAEASHGRYSREHAEFAALASTVGQQAAEVRAKLREAQADHDRSSKQLTALRGRVSELGQAAAAAGVTATVEAQAAQAEWDRMLTATRTLALQVALPGMYAAAAGTSDTAPPAAAAALTDPTAVEAFATAVTSGLDRRGSTVDQTGLLRAVSSLDRDLNATFDLILTVQDDVHLIELAGEGGRQPVAVAAAALAHKVETDAQALTVREHEVFTRFVLGGVGEELGRRLEQARGLIAAMNTSLASIRTSHGIGVKLRWELAEPQGSSIARIRALVGTNTAVRRTEENDELISLLRQRVDEQLRLDESAGYGTHLSKALDYRKWHNVEVIIVGPTAGQERRISSRAKLSQGETRFVSYVTLFAAADAYLSGLQDNDRALRLVLLDDAFAKVDDRTIGELMGLLVKLDIDFAMTGHALWGTYPQVPAIDVYEVRRAEGTSAITTHVHWDGHSRHLRAAR